MTDAERLGYLKELGTATDARDRVLKALKLDQRDTQSVFDTLYQSPTAATYEPGDNGDGPHGSNGQSVSAEGCEDERGD